MQVEWNDKEKANGTVTVSPGIRESIIVQDRSRLFGGESGAALWSPPMPFAPSALPLPWNSWNRLAANMR